MSDLRFKITMIVGNRHTGKTGTLIRQILPEYIATRYKHFGAIKVGVFDLEKNYNYEKFECLQDPAFPQERKNLLTRFIKVPVNIIHRARFQALKSGMVRILPINEFAGQFIDEVIKGICYDTKINKCLIVLEDTARFMPGNNSFDSTLRDLIINSKQRAMDIVMMFHFWTDVPPKLIKWIDEIYLHHCDESVSCRRKDVPEVKMQRILEAEARIRANAANRFYTEKIILNQ